MTPYTNTHFLALCTGKNKIDRLSQNRSDGEFVTHLM
jgi:hypothetical protein